ncbi:Cytochrome P450 302a1, mitochondrial [Papilio machaon]|uniref:Cytochrome P450 302a1, mitochondrial n=1 Tax=Papilio machaon TaxID=76193 RepID=A0A194R0N2_PAPMA|nr:Cytochrome P450 302a1, mitochondrial [Papilio machaon]
MSGHGLRYLHKQSSNCDKLMNFNDIPGPKSYPILGTLHKYWPIVGEYNAEALDKNAWLNWRRYGGLVKEVPGVNLLHVYEPDVIEAVFRQDDRHPSRRSHVAMLHYRLSKPNVYNTGGLLSTNGPDWWRLRSTFQKNFTGPQNAKQYVESADKIAREFVDWIKKSELSHEEDFLKYLNRLNLEVIGVVAMNERFNSFSMKEQVPESRSSRVIASAFGSNSGIMKLDKGILWRFFKTPLYKRLAESQHYLEKISMEILLNKINFFDKEKKGAGNSLLDSFLEQPNLDIKDITGMMVDILMAAIDTTAYATSFALYHLARNPECQSKLYDEASKLLQPNDSLTSDVLSKAVYLRSCVKESLRLNPVSVGVGRLLQKDIVLKGYLIPQGTVIVTQNMVASRLPQYVKEPLVYKPERWIRGSSQYENIHPFLSLPFGFGPRSCIARRIAEQNIYIILIRTVIVTQNMVASRLPQYVKEPLVYKPERWIRGSSQYENIHPFLSLPFGFGPRSCIARRIAEQNIYIILIRLVQEFEMKWMGGDLGIRTLLINKPDKPISLSFTPRRK